jgi:4-hydroxybenzoate polyprenyltransferase
MVLITLGLAVQIPAQRNLFGYVVMIEFILGVYQMGMSFLLMNKLSKRSRLFEVYFYSSLGYVVVLIGLGISGPAWMGELWTFALFVFPWVFALLFLVAIDELERARHYRL